ncbi:hypothetical protein [Methylosarcina fibrata]|uniref:hypothetical protein n=1 Tax=Methylosarcina fibrata TaxID=105972 RepID=UPI000369CF2E|nr:hypothetical protein [Methylosarcina fibrata]
MILEFKQKRLRVDLNEQEEKLFQVSSPYLDNTDDELVVKNSFFSDERVVRDAHRYDLRFQNGGWRFTAPGGHALSRFASNQFDQEPKRRPNQILLLLESPHKDEYSAQVAAGPALGASGRNIFVYFPTHVLPILMSLGLVLDRDHDYSFCLVNPVQYQASLVDIHKESLVKNLRDKVWMALWPECREEFIDRLERYQPAILVNGCTSTVKAELRGLLSSLESAAQRFEVTHPAAWQNAFAGFKRA